VRKDYTVGKLSECNEACDEVKDPQVQLELCLWSWSCTATTRVACVGSEMGGPLTVMTVHKLIGLPSRVGILDDCV
jgi:hypothetical protein